MSGSITLRTLAAAAALAITAGAASAASCLFGDAADFSLAQADVYTSTACIGQVSGNDKAAPIGTNVGGGGNVNLNDLDGDGDLNGSDGAFGIMTWSEAGKVDMPVANGTGTDDLLTMTLNADGKSGTWSVSSWTGIASALLVIKGSNNFAAYLLDLTAGLSGGWTTMALTNNGGQQPALSHISLYTTPAPATVPLPAAGFLLLGALGGLAALRRRKAV